MDRQKFTTIAHTDHVFYSPLSQEKADWLLQLLEFPFGLPVLDIGCGRANLLIQLCERFGVIGIGIDNNTTFIQTARTTAQTKLPSTQVTFVAQSVSEYHLAPASFAGVICMGSTHVYGSYRATLQTCWELLVPGGVALIGEGYWKCEPHLDYLRFLGATGDEFGTLVQNVETALELGFLPLYTTTSSEDEWDVYEGLYCRAVQRYVREHPTDVDAPAMQQRITQWHTMYLQYGRSTLGFGFYLLQKP